MRFSKDLSRAWVDVKIEGVNTAEINMFHIHCGKPGILGPILVDFAVATDLKSNIADGMFSKVLTGSAVAALSGAEPQKFGQVTHMTLTGRPITVAAMTSLSRRVSIT